MENPVVLKIAETLYMKSFGFKEMPKGKDASIHWDLMYKKDYIELALKVLKVIGETQN